MVQLSRFAHIFDLGSAIALYHSLRMKPVYLTREKYESLQAWLAGSFSIDVKYTDAPDSIKAEVELLKKYKILTTIDDEDDKVLEFIRARAPIPAISVCYMILSEQCKLN